MLPEPTPHRARFTRCLRALATSENGLAEPRNAPRDARMRARKLGTDNNSRTTIGQGNHFPSRATAAARQVNQRLLSPRAIMGDQDCNERVPPPEWVVSRDTHFVSSTFTGSHAPGSDELMNLRARSRKRRAGGSQSEKRSKLAAAPAKSFLRQQDSPSA